MSLALFRRSRMSFTLSDDFYRFSIQQAKSPSMISSLTKETMATQTKLVKLNLTGSLSKVSQSLMESFMSNSWHSRSMNHLRE